MERDSERTRVDCGRRSKRFLRVSGSQQASNARRATCSRWPRAAPDTGNAEGRKLRTRATLSYRARDSAGFSYHAPYTKGNFQFVRTIAGWRERYALLEYCIVDEEI